MNNGLIIKCECGYALFEKGVLKSRLVLFESDVAVAKCKRCKRETRIPFIRIVLPGEKAGKK
jgi:hypothetical protein